MGHLHLELLALLLTPLVLFLPVRIRRIPGLRALSHRPWLVVAMVGVAGFTLPAIVCLQRWPVPLIHDEFSYLLAADTFAHGRLANDPHPHWEHFESFHILQQPTYASKYPPAQGLFMALGQVTTGYPLVGKWLAAGVTAAALSWMLFNWLPARAATLTSIFALHPLLVLWGENYWHAISPALGGALVLGALPGLLGKLRIRDSVIMALGAGLLANSRPFEGLALCLPVLGYLIFWIIRSPQAPSWRVVFCRIVAPAAVTLGAVFAWMMVYNQAVTGDPLTLPYKVHFERYCANPLFIFSKPPTPEPYRHWTLENFHTRWVRKYYDEAMRPDRFYRLLWTKPFGLLLEYSGLLAAVALLPLFSVLRRRWMWAPALGLAGVLAAYDLATWSQKHYAAPMLAPVVLLLAQGLRALCAWRGSNGIGKRLCLWILVGFIATNAVKISQRHSTQPWGHRRDAIQRKLAESGRHLIFVRYKRSHDPHNEWVNNGADLNESPVVWAHDMGAAKNIRLLESWPERKVWIIEPDNKDPRPRPYDPRAELAAPPSARDGERTTESQQP
ncbi:MAG: hypothetical protein KDB14_28940 [Planctomycetales bacterium]|nr:hypothetical protein [Planctomycetales bacterium]